MSVAKVGLITIDHCSQNGLGILFRINPCRCLVPCLASGAIFFHTFHGHELFPCFPMDPMETPWNAYANSQSSQQPSLDSDPDTKNRRVAVSLFQAPAFSTTSLTPQQNRRFPENGRDLHSKSHDPSSCCCDYSSLQQIWGWINQITWPAVPRDQESPSDIQGPVGHRASRNQTWSKQHMIFLTNMKNNHLTPWTERLGFSEVVFVVLMYLFHGTILKLKHILTPKKIEITSSKPKTKYHLCSE